MPPQEGARHADPRIAYVEYPGLPSHAQHTPALEQFGGRGFGAMMAFAVDGDSATRNRFVGNVRVIISAVSLGHDETRIVHVGPDARGGSESYPEGFRTYGHLRLSVGLEDADDSTADLKGRWIAPPSLVRSVTGERILSPYRRPMRQGCPLTAAIR